MHHSRVGDIAAHQTVPRYTIDGSIDPATRTWRGSLQVVYTNRTGVSLQTLVFRRYANLADLGGNTVMSDVRVDGIAATTSGSATAFLTTVTLPKPLAAGRHATVRLSFVTRAPAARADLYGTMSGDAQTLALASAYPILALWRNGGWDTAAPAALGDLVDSEIALYDLTLRTPSTHRLVVTGSIVSQTTTKGVTTTRAVSGLQRDVAIAVTTLPAQRATVSGTTVVAYGAARPRATFLAAALQSLTIFSALYGQYPYAELEVVPVDAGSFVGIEYPGVIFIQTPYYTADRDGTQLMVHEVAHQWFYNVVGNDVQRHAFVDEGWATYSEYLYAQRTNQSSWAKQILTGLQSEYADLKRTGADSAIDQPVAVFDEAQYSGLVYAKAALYLHAMRARVGDPVFFSAAKQYATTNRYGRVDGSAFRTAVQLGCRCDVAALYTQWVLRP